MAALKQTSNMRDVSASAKVARAAGKLLTEKDMLFFVNEISYLSDSSSPYETLSTLASDISKSAKRLGDIASFMNAAQSHVVPEVVEGENDLRKIFPNHYDSKKEMLVIFGLPMKPGTELYRQSTSKLSEAIYNNTFKHVINEFSFADFKAVIRSMRKLEEETSPTYESPDSARISHVAALAEIIRWEEGFIPEVEKLGFDVQNFKKKLSMPQRNKFVERMSSGRAMIDGVAKTSTYMSPAGGIHQVSSKHKKNKSLLEKVQEKMNEVPYITGIEIDQRIPLEKYHDLLVVLKRMNLPVADGFELKGRLLGGYGACGLMVTADGSAFVEARGLASSSMSIVAFDVDFASSVAHEITHFLDRPIWDDQTGQRQGAIRNEIASYMGKKIPREELSLLLDKAQGGKSIFSVLCSDREIIARIGEIGYLLNSHNYQDGEKLDDFVARVREAEKKDVYDDEKLGFDIQVVSPIDEYLGVNSEYQKMAYFELATWDENELKTVRDFAHGYFFTPNPKVEQRLKERWENGEMFAKSILNPKKLKNRKMRTLNATSKHDDPQKEVLAQGAAMSKVNTKSLINFYREGYNSGVFKEGEVISLLERHLLRLGDQGGIKRNMSLQSVSAQFEAVIDLVHAINPSERPADAIALQGLLINMVAQNDVPIELPAFTEINMAKKSMVSALINRGMELCPDIPTKDYPMTKEAGSRHLNIGAFDALDKGLQANFSRVANEYLESMQSFSPPMPDLSHLSLTSSGPLAALHLINRSQVFEGVVDENAFDYANDMSKMCIGDNLSRKNNGEIESLALSLMRSTTPIQFNIRELLAELYPSEATIALSMVNDGVLEEWGVSENSVKDFVASFKEENIVSDYTKEHLSNVDSLEEVMNYLQNVAKGRDSLGYSNLRFTREDGSMSPLTALISLAYEHGSNVDDNAIHKAFRNVDFFSDYGIRNASYEQMEYGDRWRASLLTAGRENTATRENNPYNQWMLSQYCPVEAARMGNGDIPFVKTLSNDGEQMMKTAMVNTLIDAGKHKKTMYLNQDARVPVVSNRIYDISTRRMNVVAYKGDSKHELDLLSLESVLFACRDEQRANEAPSNELHYLYSRTRKPSEECVSLVEDWVRDLGMPQESALVLQGTQMFDSFDYSYAKEMVLDSRVISKLGDAMKLHGVEVGNYGQDMRDYTLAIEPIEALEVKVDRGGEPSPQTVSPTRSSEPLEAKEKVGEGEKNTPSVKKDDLMEVNRDVPVVDDDGVFRKVNQMSFF